MTEPAARADSVQTAVVPFQTSAKEAVPRRSVLSSGPRGMSISSVEPRELTRLRAPGGSPPDLRRAPPEISHDESTSWGRAGNSTVLLSSTHIMQTRKDLMHLSHAATESCQILVRLVQRMKGQMHCRKGISHRCLQTLRCVRHTWSLLLEMSLP